jgi:hypothetical protein
MTLAIDSMTRAKGLVDGEQISWLASVFDSMEGVNDGLASGIESMTGAIESMTGENPSVVALHGWRIGLW